MSFSGLRDKFMDDTVKMVKIFCLNQNAIKLANHRINKVYKHRKLIVVSAGNNAYNACLKSPAGSPYAYTVAASNFSNTLASFSNFGKCCNIIAPGVLCKLAVAKNTGFDFSSGTSMATPLIAGWAAVIEGRKRFNDPQKLTDYMDK
ncbi:hypothetical protein B4U80_00940, partial [Leptotrombidium deliense]